MNVTDFFREVWPWTHFLFTVVFPFFIWHTSKICKSWKAQQANYESIVPTAIGGNIVCGGATAIAFCSPFTSNWAYLWLIVPGVTFVAVIGDWLAEGGHKYIKKAIGFIGSIK